jgi:hypothetical protein
VGSVEYDIHTAAAIVKGVKADRLNGFDHWLVKRKDELIPLHNIRENERKNSKS